METLEHVCAELGYPQSIRIDQGPEFISKDLDLWAYIKGVELDASRPGNPRDNAFIESLNGKFRAECLNAHWFMNLTDARQKCEPWRIDDNNHRPHSSIGYSVPAALMKSSEPPTHPEQIRRDFLTPNGPKKRVRRNCNSMMVNKTWINVEIQSIQISELTAMASYAD